MRCGFEHLISVVPEKRIAIAEIAPEGNLDEIALHATISNGLSHLPIADGHTTASLAALAVTKLLHQRKDLLPRIEAIILAHSLPLAAPPSIDLLAPCLSVGSLEHIPAVAITGQPCAILHSAIQLARTWLLNLNPESGVLVLGVDVANHTTERFFFNSAMGDAAVAGVLTRNALNQIVLASTTETNVLAYDGELSMPQAIARFRVENPTAIRTAIENCLTVAGITLNDVRLIVPHTPNNTLWPVVAALMRLPQNRILTDYMKETGHLNSNDSFIHFLQAVQSGKLIQGDIALLVNPGFGGTRGCTLLQV